MGVHRNGINRSLCSQVMLFAMSTGSTKVSQTFLDAAKLFKGKVFGNSNSVKDQNNLSVGDLVILHFWAAYLCVC